jgi:hypothetical protein
MPGARMSGVLGLCFPHQRCGLPLLLMPLEAEPSSINYFKRWAVRAVTVVKIQDSGAGPGKACRTAPGRQWSLCTAAGLALKAGQHPDLGSEGVVERPKVIYNEHTRKFVMWMHIDDARCARGPHVTQEQWPTPS